MPNYEVDEAREMVEGIRGDIEKQRSYYSEILLTMQDERSTFEE